MTKNELMDSIGEVRGEYVEEAARATVRRISVVKALGIAACLAVCVFTAVKLLGKQEKTPVPGPVLDLKDVIWAENGVMQSVDDGIVEWNGKTVLISLKEKMEAAEENDVFAVEAHPYIDYDYVADGKTLNTWYSEWCDEKTRPEILTTLLKEGEELLGGKVDAEFYKERMEFFGEELLSRYIADGKLLTKELEKDIEEAKKDAEKGAAKGAWDKALGSYYEHVASGLAGVSDAEIRVENRSIVIFLTREQFEKLDVPVPGAWSFDLAARSGDETAVHAANDD